MITVLASDNDGWLHMRINLENLNTSCGNNNFDRIIFEDVSGMGFYLQLDDMKLLYGSAASNFAASAFTFQAGDLLPVFGDDMTVVSCPSRALVTLNQQHTARFALQLHSVQGDPATIQWFATACLGNADAYTAGLQQCISASNIKLLKPSDLQCT